MLESYAQRRLDSSLRRCTAGYGSGPGGPSAVRRVHV